jgi:hypothetical protein
MSFCPICRAEYQPGITVCADCGAGLVPQLPPLTEQRLVEVFRCLDNATALRICDVILSSIETYIHSRTLKALPVPAVSPGAEYIAVDSAQAEEARALLREAIENGAITEQDGELLTTSP